MYECNYSISGKVDLPEQSYVNQKWIVFDPWITRESQGYMILIITSEVLWKNGDLTTGKKNPLYFHWWLDVVIEERTEYQKEMKWKKKKQNARKRKKNVEFEKEVECCCTILRSGFILLLTGYSCWDVDELALGISA